MNVSEFDFVLPPGLIAQSPPTERGSSRLLVLHKASGETEHADVTRLPEFLGAGDLLVVNDTRVFPARLLGNRVRSGDPGADAAAGDQIGGAVECLLLSKLDDDHWDALVHPGQKLQPGARMIFCRDGLAIHAEVLDRHFHGRRTIRLWTDGAVPMDDAIDAIGHVPLPPYIKREAGADDRDRYQTIYANERGSVAAPTAGLHFTPGILEALEARGVERASITLHLGYGTFQPIRVTQVEAHTLEPEYFSIGEAAAETINRAKKEGRRIVAVGTTTTRALETAARAGRGVITPQTGWADLFIYPEFSFRIVNALMTNFHLPQSSLLMLVSAFGGRNAVLAAYREAVTRGYRFYSYGDAMLIL